MKLVDSDYDTTSYFVVDEDGKGCGGKLIPNLLWAQYEAAEAAVEELKAEIERWPYKPCPPPREGTFARMMWEYHRDECQRLIDSYKSSYFFSRQPKADD